MYTVNMTQPLSHPSHLSSLYTHTATLQQCAFRHWSCDLEKASLGGTVPPSESFPRCSFGSTDCL